MPAGNTSAEAARIDGWWQVPNLKIKALPLSEKQVTEQVKQFLESQGWLFIRLQSGLLRTADRRFLRVGKVGTPDAIAILGCYYPGYARAIFLEFKKSKGGKVSADQLAWHAEAKKKDLEVFVVSDFDTFRKQFEIMFPKTGICDDRTVPLGMY